MMLDPKSAKLLYLLIAAGGVFAAIWGPLRAQYGFYTLWPVWAYPIGGLGIAAFALMKWWQLREFSDDDF